MIVVDECDLGKLKDVCIRNSFAPSSLFLERGHPEIKPILARMKGPIANQLSALQSDQLDELFELLYPYCGMRKGSNVDFYELAFHIIKYSLHKICKPVQDVLDDKINYPSVFEIFPELNEHLDKNSLLFLNSEMIPMDAGVVYKKQLLYCSQFLRRHYTSNPNYDFLTRFAINAQKDCKGNIYRLAIDKRRYHDIKFYSRIFEADYWYGPLFSDEGLDDLSEVGLTVHVRNEPSFFDMSYRIDRLEILWSANRISGIKSVEIEEVTYPHRHHDGYAINRYVHAERDTKGGFFRHFDGAVKIYRESDYPPRLDRHNRMPKQQDPFRYIKLFRIDGEISTEDFVELTSYFFRGNELVIEYFDPDLYNKEFKPRENKYKARILGRKD